MSSAEPIELKRSLSLPMLTFYGLGTILGAGIYVLIGEVAGLAGLYTPLAFLLASVLAAFTAFSYAELSARYPVSAGEAVYVQRAFGRKEWSRLIGLSIVVIGMISSATLVKGFVGYLHVFVDVPGWLVIVSFTLFLGAVAAWGIQQAAWLALISTFMEIGGLLLVLWAGHDIWGELPARLPELWPPMESVAWMGIAAGAFVAFYAFIGFEDIVNVAEEVKQPRRNLPLAVLLALVIATLLYMAVALTAVLAVPAADLAGSSAPLALIYERSTGQDPVFISLISLSAVINGALIQIIMATRILYGMSRQQWLPQWLGRVHPVTRTPLLATVLVTLIILILALWLPLLTLAETTSFITLLVFAMVNLSLWRVKRREPPPEGIRVYPLWLPVVGALACMAFVLFKLYHWLLA